MQHQCIHNKCDNKWRPLSALVFRHDRGRLCGELPRACLKLLQPHRSIVPVEGPGLVWPTAQFQEKTNSHLWILNCWLMFLKNYVWAKESMFRGRFILKSLFCDLWHLWIYSDVYVLPFFCVYLLPQLNILEAEESMNEVFNWDQLTNESF